MVWVCQKLQLIAISKPITNPHLTLISIGSVKISVKKATIKTRIPLLPRQLPSNPQTIKTQ